MKHAARKIRTSHSIKFNSFVTLNLFFMLLFPVAINAQEVLHLWGKTEPVDQTILTRIPVPEGYQRAQVEVNSFEEWLRQLPLKSGDNTVYLYDGRKKYNQKAQFAVVDIDVGKRNLQQCADAVMRLRAEYLFSKNEIDKISFNFTSGDACRFSEWSQGSRPKVSGNTVTWRKTTAPDRTHKSFRKYLNTVFSYAGSYSLSKELLPQTLEELKAGDLFIQGGFPGHAMLIVDVAVHQQTGHKIFLLLQSYMPAQDMHIVVNPTNSNVNPWFEVAFGKSLVTPEWTFEAKDLKKF